MLHVVDYIGLDLVCVLAEDPLFVVELATFAKNQPDVIDKLAPAAVGALDEVPL